MLMCDTSTAVRIKTAAILGRFTEVDAVSVTCSNIRAPFLSRRCHFPFDTFLTLFDDSLTLFDAFVAWRLKNRACI